ncbi:MAG: pilus assembly FimT family protein [Pseudomonadota bacterium]
MSNDADQYSLRSSRWANRGLTLVELLIVVVIVGVMATVALPAFDSFVDSNRLTSKTNDVVGALNYARSEASSRGDSVDIKPLGGSWGDGLVVEFQGSTLTRIQTGNGVSFSGETLTFRGIGDVSDGNAKCFDISAVETGESRSVRVSPAGQIRTSGDACGS